MAKIPFEQIKERARIEEYLPQFYPKLGLIRSGNVYKARCPFHDEKTSSFAVFPEKQNYHCFGCGAHGDVVNFVMAMESLGVKEASRLVADNVGVSYTLTPPNPHHEAYKDKMDEHTRRYWKVLQKDPAALDYLRVRRGLTDLSIKNFRIGLVPSDEYKYRNDMGGIAGRISFPILEMKDAREAKCVGMGYRTLTGDPAKYINDKNQVGSQGQDPNLNGVFIKGQNFYGYSLAHRAIRQFNFAVVVEGYMDVISLHQANVLNTIGSMGTALTEFQMDALRKVTPNLYLWMDADKAGIQAMMKYLPELYFRSFNVMIITSDFGMDPADVCLKLKFDPNAMQKYITTHSRPAMSILIDKAAMGYEQVVVQQRLRAMAMITPVLDKIQNQAEKDIFTRLAYKKLDIMG